MVEQRRAEILESLVELYMRLNGYFCIRNYLQHRSEGFGLETEFDLLAIRMPYQAELLPDGSRQRNDETLILPDDPRIIDCVIAEVKENPVEFNKPIRGSGGVERIASALRMFGLFPDCAFREEGAPEGIARDLHVQINRQCWRSIPGATDGNISVRMIVFAPPTAEHAQERDHKDLQEILNFTSSRMRLGVPCSPYRNQSDTTGSPWRGVHSLIVHTFDQYRDENPIALEIFVGDVLSRWPTDAAKSAPRRRP